MAKCEVCARPPQFGNSVSHSNRRTRRTFDVSVSKSTIRCECRNVEARINICNACLRSFDYKGVDEWTKSNRKVWRTIESRGLRKFFQECYECHKFGFDKKKDI